MREREREKREERRERRERDREREKGKGKREKGEEESSVHPAVAISLAHGMRENSTRLGCVALTGGPVCVWERGACVRGGFG